MFDCFTFICLPKMENVNIITGSKKMLDVNFIHWMLLSCYQLCLMSYCCLNVKSKLLRNSSKFYIYAYHMREASGLTKKKPFLFGNPTLFIISGQFFSLQHRFMTPEIDPLNLHFFRSISELSIFCNQSCRWIKFQT